MKYSEHEHPEMGRVYELEEAIEFEIEGRTCTVPAGFQSDGCSCPRWLWPVFSPARKEKYLYAAIVHDYLYATHPCSRKAADKWYRDALIDAGCTAATAYAGYYALRLCGASHWRNDVSI